MNDKLNQSDFSIIIDYGAVVPIENSTYNDGRINVELYDRDDYKITIEGKTYDIKSDEQYKKIKEYISINLDKLIDCSKKEDKSFLDNNVYEGVTNLICIKYGQLLITINGAVNGVIGEFAEKFISEILEIIVDEETNVSERKVIEHTNDEKKQVINEWKEYLKLDEEEFLWVNKNRAYLSKLYNILYSLKQQQDNDVIYKQYELVSSCPKFINLFDKAKITEIVNQLSDLEKQNDITLDKISKEIFNKINELPSDSEFTMFDYLKNYELETKEMFEVNKKVLDLCNVNNVEIDNLMSGAILGMPWVYPLKKN